ncbi:hypothetical protein HK100_012940 [Physocladia obscura]|uniref:Uncharacterized protein n=1 Tax=Physocladia obscura TaxID=109957 RepID=A0AAD5T4Z3_9FUNG|nr:hypothetical protein HK100_012940 [Physocladia obscura]
MKSDQDTEILNCFSGLSSSALVSKELGRNESVLADAIDSSEQVENEAAKTNADVKQKKRTRLVQLNDETKFDFYDDYMKLLVRNASSSSSHTAERAQRILRLTKWFCFDRDYLARAESFASADPATSTTKTKITNKNHEISALIIAFPISAVKAFFSVDNNNAFSSVVYQIEDLEIRKNLIVDSRSKSIFERFADSLSLFSNKKIGATLSSTLVCLVLSAVHKYNPKPLIGVGTWQPLCAVRAELWIPILSYSFKLAGISFESTYILGHIDLHNTEKDFHNSAYAAATIRSGFGTRPFFLVHFKYGALATEQEQIATMAEAIYQLQILVSAVKIPDLHKLKFFVAFVSDNYISFDVIIPKYDDKTSTIYYIHEQNLAEFVPSNYSGSDIHNTLQLLAFLETVVNPYGKALKDLIKNGQGFFETSFSLPVIPEFDIKLGKYNTETLTKSPTKKANFGSDKANGK